MYCNSTVLPPQPPFKPILIGRLLRTAVGKSPGVPHAVVAASEANDSLPGAA